MSVSDCVVGALLLFVSLQVLSPIRLYANDNIIRSIVPSPIVYTGTLCGQIKNFLSTCASS